MNGVVRKVVKTIEEMRKEEDPELITSELVENVVEGYADKVIDDIIVSVTKELKKKGIKVKD